MRYTGDHTGTICPECGPCCWDVSPAARERAREYADRQDQAARRERRATVAVPQQAIDAQGREAQRWQDRLLAITDRVLADQHITMDTRSDFAWFRGQLTRGGEPLSMDRLGQLDCEMGECPVERAGWLRRALKPDDYAGLDEDEDYPAAIPGEVVHGAIPAPPPVPALTASTPLCETCLAAGLPVSAAARISSSVPAMIPERDACLQHYQDAAAIIGRMTFANLYVISRYGRHAAVTSIVKVTGSGILPAGKAGQA